MISSLNFIVRMRLGVIGIEVCFTLHTDRHSVLNTSDLKMERGKNAYKEILLDAVLQLYIVLQIQTAWQDLH